jgi:hypothetical protein
MRLSRETDREIVTTRRGKRIATSIEGSLTGLGGNTIVIDDPIKLGDAHSEAVRERSIEWYRSTVLSRADDKTLSRIVVVMQRVHQNDLSGYPPIQLYGTTGRNWQAAAIRHQPFGAACSLCLFPADQEAAATGCASAPEDAPKKEGDKPLVPETETFRSDREFPRNVRG